MLTYKETLKYLDSFVNYEQIGPDRFKGNGNLDKLRNVLKRLGNPQRRFRSVHISGTKGKGSVSTFTSSILEESGYRVGLFTSPHLDTAFERIRINGKNIGKTEFVRTVNYLREYIDHTVGTEFTPLDGSHLTGFTFFEIYTLIAILYFSIKKVDFAVFEVGMGGRLDATNVIDAEVCGITPVSYDHMQVLGRSLKQIAREKSAIIKRGAHCVSSSQRVSALRVIKDRCKEKGAFLSFVGKDITYHIQKSNVKGSQFDVSSKMGRYRKCRTKMPGSFQVSNCCAAIGICESILGRKGINKSIVKRGIRCAFVPGRMEVVCRRPTVVIDGAQNGDSVRNLKLSIEQIFKYDKLILLLGVSQDKDIKGICRHISPLADNIVLSRASISRALDPHLIRGYIKGKRVRITNNVKEALGVAFQLAGKNDLILATGSFYLIGEVRRMILDGNYYE